MNFKATTDRLCVITTSVITVLFLVIISVQLIPMYAEHPVLTLFIAGILVGTYGYCFVFRPLGYQITADAFVVNRLSKRWLIPAGSVKNVRVLLPEEMKFTTRVFGVGGLFGYWGIFSNAQVGRMKMFATRRDKTVLIETTEGQKIVVTPDEPEAFVSALNAMKEKRDHGVSPGSAANP